MTNYLIPRDLDFTFPDYESIFSRLTSSVSSVLSRWTNFLRATFENVLLGNECFNFDVLMGYLEQRIRETRLASVLNRAMAVRLARLHHNYRPDENTAASGGITVSIATSTADDVQFPAGTVIFTPGPNRVSGQLLEAKTITAGNTTVDGIWEHSETVQFSFIGTGLPKQRFPLNQAPYLWESGTLNDGTDDWDEITFFSDYGAADKVYRVEMDENGYAEYVFGDGTYGAMPTGALTGDYKIGGGLDGNVALGSLTRVSGVFTDDSGNPVTVSAANAAVMTGGLGEESVDLIRLKAPAAGKAQERSVGREDMETNAARVAAIATALVLTVEERAGIAENTGHVYGVGYGTKTNNGRYRPTAATTADKTAMVIMLEETYPVPNTFDVLAQDTVFNEVNFEMDIELSDGYTLTDVALSIYNALDDFFGVALSDADGKGPNTSMGFGEQLNLKLRWSTLFNIVVNVAGVEGVNEDTFIPPNEVILETYEWPKLGTLRITDVDSGSYVSY